MDSRQRRSIFEEAFIENKLDMLRKNDDLPIEEAVPVFCIKKPETDEAWLPYSSKNLFEVQTFYDNGKGYTQHVKIDWTNMLGHKEYKLENVPEGIPMPAYIHAAQVLGEGKHKITTDYADITQSQWIVNMGEFCVESPKRQQPYVSRPCRRFNQ